MKLGIIVLPDTNEELTSLIKTLQGAGHEVEALEEKKAPAKKAPAKTPVDDLDDLDDLGEPETEELKVPSIEELRALLTKVRDEAGTDMLKEILTSFGATNLKTLDQSDWASCYAAGQAVLTPEDDGLGDDLDDGFDDLDGDDLDDTTELDPEEVKVLCQAYAKAHGREEATQVLKDAGLNSVRGIKSASQDVLAKIHKAVKNG